MASTETMVCYRHPKNETAVACSNCGRPICTDCMVFAPVGIKCPECAGRPVGVKKVTSKAKSAASAGTGALVTKTLIGINVLVYLLQLSQTTDPTSLGNEIFRKYALFGPAVADGEWYRLATAGFLHASVTHILFNMVMLWWFGSSLEGFLGRARFLTVYLVSLIAGSAGALLLDTNAYTVGASGAVFGVLGAGVVLERRGFPVFGGSALLIVLLNLGLGFFTAGISIGGHLGGLAGGAVAVMALGGFTRGHAAFTKIGAPAILGIAGILVASMLIAYLSVHGTISI